MGGMALTYQELLIYIFSMGGLAVSLRKAAAVFHALSDETRLELLERLKNGEECVCELTDAMKTAQSRLSFHLKVLKDAGLIHDRRDGRWMYYSLNPDALEDLEDLVGRLKKSAQVGRSASGCW
jgi:ArsR family transcriptional regulator